MTIQQAVILAAGRGSRLGKLSEYRSKAMQPVAGKPIIQHLIERLQSCGITKIAIVVHYRHEEITEYFEQYPIDDIDLTFVYQEDMLGTADALLHAAPYINDDFIMTSVDNWIDADSMQSLANLHKQSLNDMTLVLLPTTADVIAKSSKVEVEGDRVLQIVEKPQNPTDGLASIMLYAFSPKIFDYAQQVGLSKRGEKELQTAMQSIIADGHQVGYIEIESRLHLTTAEDLRIINVDYLQSHQPTICLSDVPESVILHPPYIIGEDVQFGDNAVIGPNVYIEAGSNIADRSLLSNDVIINVIS